MKKNNNLKKLRKESNLTQQNVADFLKCTQTTIYQYETGITEPDINTLIKLADYFNVSVDYLIGRANDDEIVHIFNNISEDEEYLLEMIRQLPQIDKQIIYKFTEFTLKQHKEKDKKQ